MNVGDTIEAAVEIGERILVPERVVAGIEAEVDTGLGEQPVDLRLALDRGAHVRMERGLEAELALDDLLRCFDGGDEPLPAGLVEHTFSAWRIPTALVHDDEVPRAE